MAMIMYNGDEFDAKCPSNSCESDNIVTDHDRGEVLCGDCGRVMAESMADWRSDAVHSLDEYMTQTRTGPRTSLMMYDRGLSTMIGADKDSSGNALNSKTRGEFYRLRLWDRQSKSRAAASMSRAFTLLHAMKSKLAVPNGVVEGAAGTYRKAVAAGLTRGRTIASLIAASLYIACRQNNIPRTLDDIVSVSNVDRKVLFRDLRTILEKLDIRLEQYNPASFAVKISNNMNLSERTKRGAIEILKRCEQERITSGKHPVALAAAAVYISCASSGETITQRSLSKTASISDVTIHNSVRMMCNALDMN